MQNLKVRTNQQFGKVRILDENGTLYYLASDVAKALGYSNPRKAISDHCRCVTKRDIPHPQSKTKVISINFIPEPDVYRLICHSKLPSAIEFEKWVFEDVVPKAVREQTTPQPECEQLTLSETSSAPYKYIDKLYKGQPVLSAVDIEAFTGINKSSVDWYLHTKRDFIIGVDYFFLKGQELADFKEENPRISKLSAAMYLITKSGFEKLMKKCGKQCASPKCFIEQKPKKKEEYAVVIDNTRIQAMIAHIKKELVAVDVLLDKYNRHNILVDDMEALKKTISDVGMELSCDISGLAHEKYRTTFEMKI